MPPHIAGGADRHCGKKRAKLKVAKSYQAATLAALFFARPIPLSAALINKLPRGNWPGQFCYAPHFGTGCFSGAMGRFRPQSDIHSQALRRTRVRTVPRPHAGQAPWFRDTKARGRAASTNGTPRGILPGCRIRRPANYYLL